MYRALSNGFKFWNRSLLKTAYISGDKCDVRICVPCKRSLRYKSGDSENNNDGGKYRIFRDEDAPIILDVEEERAQYNQSQQVAPTPNKFEGLNMQRGQTGVFDLEDLVSVLERDGTTDVVVLELPLDLKYVQWLVVATGKSRRHLWGTAQLVKRAYKEKRFSSDQVPKIEGDSSADWIALDLGNIALHLMSRSTRKKYDLESLWSLGPEYDAKCNEKDDEIVQLLNKHKINLDDFQPASSSNS